LPAVNQKTAEKFIVSGKQHSVIGLFARPHLFQKIPLTISSKSTMTCHVFIKPVHLCLPADFGLIF
jgi:hypothetical protein